MPALPQYSLNLLFSFEFCGDKAEVVSYVRHQSTACYFLLNFVLYGYDGNVVIIYEEATCYFLLNFVREDGVQGNLRRADKKLAIFF